MEETKTSLNFEAEKQRIEKELAEKKVIRAAIKEAAKLIAAGMGIAEVKSLLEEKFPEIEQFSGIRSAVRAKIIAGEIAQTSRRKAERAAKEAEKATKQQFRHARLELLRDEYKGLHRQKYMERAGKFGGREDEIWVNQTHIGVPYQCRTLKAAESLAERIGNETSRDVEIYSVMSVKTRTRGGITWRENYLDTHDRVGVFRPDMVPGRQFEGEMTGFPNWPDMALLR